MGWDADAVYGGRPFDYVDPEQDPSAARGSTQHQMKQWRWQVVSIVSWFMVDSTFHPA